MTVAIEVLTNDTRNDRFAEMEAGSFYTITGTGGDMNQWVTGYSKLLEEKGIGTPSQWFSFTGKDMNEAFGLTGTTAYKDDLTFLAFALDGLDGGKLALFKLRMEDRWFDDIVANNAL
jgi:hypothetical protein